MRTGLEFTRRALPNAIQSAVARFLFVVALAALLMACNQPGSALDWSPSSALSPLLGSAASGGDGQASAPASNASEAPEMEPQAREEKLAVNACEGAAPSADAAALVEPPLPSAGPDPRTQSVLGRGDELIRQGIGAGAFPGAVLLIGHEGKVVKHTSYGTAVQFGPDGRTLDQPIPMRDDTIFDVASLTKLFTAVAVMQLVECGAVDLDLPVQTYLPEFTGAGKEKVLVRHLLSHSSGLPAGSQGPRPLIRNGDSRAERLRHVLETPLNARPGETVVYSDTGFITLGALVERVAGLREDAYLNRFVLGPLGMSDTGYLPPADKARIAATTLSPASASSLRERLLHGVVHDEDAWSLSGVAGHAGMFSTAPDLARFAAMLVGRGTYVGVQILRPETLVAMTQIESSASDGELHGLGFDINQPWYMGELAGPQSVGHLGYTGVSFVSDIDRRTFAVLLTNRLHPTDKRDNIRRYRSGVGDLAAAVAASGKPGE